MPENKNNILTNVKKIHLIGIGGIGMSGIAEFLERKGYEISGSDLYPSQITERLKSFGIKIFEGHNSENITGDIDLVIYTSAVKKDNPEYEKAIKLGIKMVKRAVMLGEIVNDLYLISVSGTHGKTSTTAMIAKILIDNGFEPYIFVGGTLDFLEGGSSRIGKGNIAVVEADEYDRSFLSLKSNVIIITNIELDHTDIYKDLKELKDSFKQFIDNAEPGAKIIACGDDLNVLDLTKNIDKKHKIFYGLKDNNNYKIENIINTNGKTYFDLEKNTIRLKVPGLHNALNATASYLACNAIGVDLKKFAESIFDFSGVKRRLELKYKNDIIIYDDYAHHPTEVSASFKAIRDNAKGRIITVFQPHTFTRTRDLYNEFAESLKENDVVILTDIYPAREKEIKGVSSELIYNILKNIQKEIYYTNSFENAIQILDKVIKKDDTIIFQGAGSITELCDMYVKRHSEVKE
jgi:UDP-N-acetylmuramate--alanine ligase